MYTLVFAVFRTNTRVYDASWLSEMSGRFSARRGRRALRCLVSALIIWAGTNRREALAQCSIPRSGKRPGAWEFLQVKRARAKRHNDKNDMMPLQHVIVARRSRPCVCPRFIVIRTNTRVYDAPWLSEMSGRFSARRGRRALRCLVSALIIWAGTHRREALAQCTIPRSGKRPGAWEFLQVERARAKRHNDKNDMMPLQHVIVARRGINRFTARHSL